VKEALIAMEYIQRGILQKLLAIFELSGDVRVGQHREQALRNPHLEPAHLGALHLQLRVLHLLLELGLMLLARRFTYES
jgi:hypothetical protein